MQLFCLVAAFLPAVNKVKISKSLNMENKTDWTDKFLIKFSMGCVRVGYD